MKVSLDPATMPKLDTPLDVLVVGGGWGGLTAAMAFKRRNCNVTVLEATSEFKSLGGMLGLTPNGLRMLDRYSPGCLQDLYSSAVQIDRSHFRHFADGRIVGTQYLNKTDYKMLMGYRNKFHEIFLDHALKAGIEIVTNARVREFHDEEGSRPFVITTREKKYEGDLMVCFDGIKSPARDYIVGYPSPPIPTGYSIYRGYAPGNLLAADSITVSLVDKGDSAGFWLGDNQHFVAHTSNDGKDWFWALMRPDNVGQAKEESYSAPGDIKDVVELLRYWDPRLV